MDPELPGKTGVFPCSGLPQPVLEKIRRPINAICFPNFTSEKWGKNVIYARFFGNYARNPGPEQWYGTSFGSCHRRRTRTEIHGKDTSLSQSHSFHGKLRHISCLPLEPVVLKSSDIFFRRIFSRDFYLILLFNFFVRHNHSKNFTPEKISEHKKRKRKR